MSLPTRRIWSEFVDHERLTHSSTLQLLAERDIQLLAAVRPNDVERLPALVRACSDAGVSLGLWPMLRDDDGRWGSAFNAPVYCEFVLWVHSTAPVATMAIDLEPPITLLRRLVNGNPSALPDLLSPAQRASGHTLLVALVTTLGERGCHTLGTVNPLVLADKTERPGWQWLLGTPTEGLPFHRLNFMSYTSLFEGYSRGLLSRSHALALLMQSAQLAHNRFDERASLSVGCVGGGALGDEKPYRDIDELVQDLRVAHTCGINDLALFDLSGVLEQPHPEAWLDAFVQTETCTSLPKLPWRNKQLIALLQQGSAGISLYRRLAVALTRVRQRVL